LFKYNVLKQFIIATIEQQGDAVTMLCQPTDEKFD